MKINTIYKQGNFEFSQNYSLKLKKKLFLLIKT